MTIMKKSRLILSYLALFLVCSCATTAPVQQYEPSEKNNESISDGYTSTSMHNRTGAGGFVEHPNTIMTFDNYLRGLPGVNIVGTGASATVTVRGINSFQPGSIEPLFILNGIAMSSYSVVYSTINPVEIKRVSVLTDAASTGIYGSRGANGVIVVTLKNTK
jgi:TonB-dependent SusC/RagA subfamily outer membrane receptor